MNPEQLPSDLKIKGVLAYIEPSAFSGHDGECYISDACGRHLTRDGEWLYSGAVGKRDYFTRAAAIEFACQHADLPMVSGRQPVIVRAYDEQRWLVCEKDQANWLTHREEWRPMGVSTECTAYRASALAAFNAIQAFARRERQANCKSCGGLGYIESDSSMNVRRRPCPDCQTFPVDARRELPDSFNREIVNAFGGHLATHAWTQDILRKVLDAIRAQAQPASEGGFYEAVAWKQQQNADALADSYQTVKSKLIVAEQALTAAQARNTALEEALRDVIDGYDGWLHACDDPDDGCAEEWAERITAARAALAGTEAGQGAMTFAEGAAEVISEYESEMRAAVPQIVSDVKYRASLAEDARQRVMPAPAPQEPSQPGHYVEDLQQRCTALQQRLNESDKALGSLLAIINRDGGHYQDQHGTAKAVEDAHRVWAEIQKRLYAVRGLRARIKEAADTAYCDHIRLAASDKCCGQAAKMRVGSFGEPELKAHKEADNKHGQHVAFHEALRMMDVILTPTAKEGK